MTEMEGKVRFNLEIGNFDEEVGHDLEVEIFDRTELVTVHASTRQLPGIPRTSFEITIPQPSSGRRKILSCMNSGFY